MFQKEDMYFFFSFSSHIFCFYLLLTPSSHFTGTLSKQTFIMIVITNTFKQEDEDHFLPFKFTSKMYIYFFLNHLKFRKPKMFFDSVSLSYSSSLSFHYPPSLPLLLSSSLIFCIGFVNSQSLLFPFNPLYHHYIIYLSLYRHFISSLLYIILVMFPSVQKMKKKVNTHLFMLYTNVFISR